MCFMKIRDPEVGAEGVSNLVSRPLHDVNFKPLFFFSFAYDTQKTAIVTPSWLGSLKSSNFKDDTLTSTIRSR